MPLGTPLVVAVRRRQYTCHGEGLATVSSNIQVPTESELMMNRRNWFSLSGALLLSACVVAPVPGPRYAYIRARVAPPVEQVEVIPAAPGPNYFWIRGHWHWENGRHVWIPGHYEGHRTGSRWVPARWAANGPEWELIPGHWESN